MEQMTHEKDIQGPGQCMDTGGAPENRVPGCPTCNPLPLHSKAMCLSVCLSCWLLSGPFPPCLSGFRVLAVCSPLVGCVPVST